jgi:DNA-binding transcriptional regulator YiaG
VSALIDEVRQGQRLPAPRLAAAIRVAAGVTQGRLAEELGVHRVSVARWESGARKPRGKMRAAYARVLEDLKRELEGES